MEALQFPLYISTKAALASFVRCMGDLEGMHGIRVTGVLPGIVSTLLNHKHLLCLLAKLSITLLFSCAH
jgi:NAD(P)-dependent dehydrogenase (short-subunit alcohol dehydrogenase family)